MRDTCKNGACYNPVKTNGFKKDGSRKYHKLCSQCCKKRYKDTWRRKYIPKPRKPWQGKYEGYIKLSYCECCSFVAVNKCQLDVDHINGDHSNNSSDNLQTLCSNCHRLKTWMNKDWEKS